MQGFPARFLPYMDKINGSFVRSARPKHRLPMALFLGVMLVAMVQALWWVYFQVAEGERFRQLQLGVFAERVQVASQELARADHAYTEQERRQFCKRFPGLALTRSNQYIAGFAPELSSETYSWIWKESNRRTRMFVFEGVFFALLLAFAVFLQLRAHRRVSGAFEQQSNFIAAVTHELKSPLTSIRLYTELLESSNLEPVQRADCVHSSLQEVDRLNALVEQILRARMVDTCDLNLHLQYFDLADYIRGWFPRQEKRAKQRGFELTLTIQGELASSCYHTHADEDALDTVMSNLVDNAMKYGGPATVQGGKPVRLTLKKVGNEAVIGVEDEGVGFEPAEGRRLFGRFYRSGSELTREVPGTGLGLFLVQQLVLAMQGRVSASSDGQGQGARFDVFLPLVKTKEA